jgi:hypothetical protein
MTLTEFLLARIAEDEAVAKEFDRELERDFGSPKAAALSSDLAVIGSGYMDYPALSIDSTRVLAECEAKRRIVERFGVLIGDRPPESSLDEDGWVLIAWETLYDLASVYADHPDFREEWRA